MSMIAYPADEQFGLNLRGLSISGRKVAEVTGAELFRLMAAQGIPGIVATMGKQELEMVLAQFAQQTGRNN
jgi:hypothetical protein